MQCRAVVQDATSRMRAGHVEVLHNGSRPVGSPALRVCELATGDYFGEIALLEAETLPGVTPNRRVATVRSVRRCELQSVSKECVQRCFLEFPEVANEIVPVAHRRLEMLQTLHVTRHG